MILKTIEQREDYPLIEHLENSKDNTFEDGFTDVELSLDDINLIIQKIK